MRSCLLTLVSFGLFFVSQCRVEAGFLVSTVASLAGETALDATVNVSVYGINNGALPNELVNSYGVTVTVNGVAPIFSNAQYAGGVSEWGGLNNKPTPTTTSNTITFQAYKTPLDTPNVSITGTTAQPTTLIGTFSFTVGKQFFPQAYSTTTSAAPALTAGNSAIGNGFQFYATGFWADIPTTYNFNSAAGVGTIAAVPEPSTLGLLGLATCGYLIRRRDRSVKLIKWK